MSEFIRLVPDKAPEPLSDVEAIESAKEAWTRAKDAQAELVSNLYLTKMLARRSNVNHSYLKGCRTEARKQVELAREVLAAVEASIEALEGKRR